MAASASAAPPATPPAKPVAPDAALEALEKAEPFTAPADVLRRAAPDAPEHVSAELLVDDVAISYDAEQRITRHEHRIWRVLSAEGVDQLGTLSFPWEPWHQARPVVRARVVTADGRELQLDPKTVSDAAGRVHGQVIDDRKELVVPLPGVGRGSTLEVDVEVRSERAVFDAPAASSRYYFWTDFPVRWLRLRVSAPGTGLHWTAKNFEARGLKVVESQPSGRKLVEVVTHLGTDDQPTTVAEIPWLAWSTGGTWQAMARSYHGAVTQALASPPPDGALPAPKGSPREQADAILTALRARVRYTGLELGQSAVVPYTPAEVWQREYGDCKDMAVLMVHGLSRAGIDARVALLSAGFADDVPSDMVGLDGFDHAIVYVPAQRGADAFWIDPTATDYPAGALPAGDLERRALVIDPATSGLVSTATRDVWPARFRAETTIQLAQLGGAEVDDTLRYEAAYASQVRSSMVGKPQQDLKFTRRWLEDLHGTKSFDDLSVEGAPDAVIVRAKGHEALRYVTGLSSADIDLPRSHIFGSIPSELVDDDRKPLPYRFDQALQLASRARIVAPLGFVLAAGAGSETIQLGPARWTQTIAAAPGEVGVATAEVTLDFGKLDYTSDDVTAFRKAFDALTGNVHKIVFRHAAGSLVAEGDVKGGLARFAEHLAAHPDDAGTRARLALALCDLGVTPAARTEAEKAVKLDPKSRLAAFSQAFIASGDPLCRSMVQGWDRAAAVKAYERLSERFPTWTRARLKLAQILERGARARLDSSGPDVDRAIDVYRKLVKDESVEDAKEPYLKALWRAGRVKDLVADGPSLAMSVATGAMWLAAVSIDQSPAAALRQVSQLKGDAGAYLSAAIASLMLTRHYPEAAGLAAATLERMPESAYARTIAELAPRVHVVVGSDDFSTPEKALRSVYVRLAGVGPNDDPVPALISAIHPDHARGDDVGSGAAAAADDGTSGMGTAAAGIDMLLSIGTVSSVGDDQTGYRVRLEANLGGSPMRIDTFWAKTPAGLRLVSFQDAAELGERAHPGHEERARGRARVARLGARAGVGRSVARAAGRALAHHRPRGDARRPRVGRHLVRAGRQHAEPGDGEAGARRHRALAEGAARRRRLRAHAPRGASRAGLAHRRLQRQDARRGAARAVRAGARRARRRGARARRRAPGGRPAEPRVADGGGQGRGRARRPRGGGQALRDGRRRRRRSRHERVRLERGRARRGQRGHRAQRQARRRAGREDARRGPRVGHAQHAGLRAAGDRPPEGRRRHHAARHRRRRAPPPRGLSPARAHGRGAGLPGHRAHELQADRARRARGRRRRSDRRLGHRPGAPRQAAALRRAAQEATMLLACPGDDCPLRMRCYRFRMAVFGRYDAFGRAPYDAARAGCEHFEDLESRRPTRAAVETRAYHRWVARGRPDGDADRDWHEAEAEVQAAFDAGMRPLG
ncbi:MAG: DUF3857 domain-containing protein [Myxococcota bacterium]